MAVLLLASVFCFSVGLHIHCTVAALPKVRGLNADCYARLGDLNIALLSGFSDQGDENLCALKPVPWLSIFFQFYEAFAYAIDLVNARDDLLPNVTLGYVTMDTCWRDLAALAQAMYLVPETGQSRDFSNNGLGDPITCSEGRRHFDVVGVVGPGSSAESMMVAGLFSVLQIPVMATLATSDELSDEKRFGYLLRLVSPNKFQVEALLDFLTHFNWTYVSLLYSDDSYGEDAAKLMITGVTDRGICMPFVEMIPGSLTTERAGIVVGKLVRNNRARVVVVFLHSAEIATIFGEIQDRDKVGEFIWVSGDSLSDTKLGPVGSGAFILHYRVESAPQFEQHYLSLTPSAHPKNPWMAYLWEMFYHCSWNQSASNNSCSQYADQPYLAQYPSSSSLIYMDGVMTFAHALHRLIAEKCPEAFNGTTDVRSCVTGPTLLKELRQVSFDGYSGNVKFDDNGDRLGIFEIKQFIHADEHTYEVVALWDKKATRFDVYHERIKWKPFQNQEAFESFPQSVCSVECSSHEYFVRGDLPCCWECRRCRDNEFLINNRSACQACESTTWPDDVTGTSCQPITPDYLRWSDVTSMVLAVLASVGLVSNLCTSAFFIRHRSLQTIKASSRELSAFILGGITLAFISALLQLAKPTVGICTVARFAFHISGTTIYAPLFVKTLRIYRIFLKGKQGVKKPRLTGNRAQIICTTVLILMQVKRHIDTEYVISLL